MLGDRKRIHSERLWSFSNDSIEEANERGRAWVQRNFREWPYGHSLLYQIQTRDEEDWVDFYFVPDSDDDSALF